MTLNVGVLTIGFAVVGRKNDRRDGTRVWSRRRGQGVSVMLDHAPDFAH